MQKNKKISKHAFFIKLVKRHFGPTFSPVLAKNFTTNFFPRKEFQSISSLHAAVTSCKNVFINLRKPHFSLLAQKPQNNILPKKKLNQF